MSEGVGGGSSGSVDQPAALIPMEETVEALIVYLVAPLLPARASFHPPPTIDQQKAVAKQSPSLFKTIREKTTIRVYIMNYTEAMNEGLVEIPIKDVISSLQGPLIRTDQPSEVTSVELDDLCYELGWTLPQYRVLPSILDGMFQATVTLKRVEL
ncbi:hypothetical protein C4D60_Mb05t27250 [Musa balbisiana]|uniref:Uncharacterized protein n=1 Tax=Musa balbisiana TaxID=52838 RepID=A0A4S8JZ64_MUSBA|nr:hypothetical protein C4D60_Mb05t27250 [Musa balbisiana]